MSYRVSLGAVVVLTLCVGCVPQKSKKKHAEKAVPESYGGPKAKAAPPPAPAPEPVPEVEPNSDAEVATSAGATPVETATVAAPPAKTPEELATAFLEEADAKLKKLYTDWSRAEWIKATYIMHDSEILAAKFHQEVMAYTAEALARAASFDTEQLQPETARKLHLLKISLAMPPPTDTEAQARLAELSARLESLYGAGSYCNETGECRDLGTLSATIADPDASYASKLEAWQGWRTISRPMRPLYQEFVKLGNQGASDVGFDNVGQMWRASYDMDPAAFEQEVERLWNQVAPLYEQLHCYVRAKLSEKYGEEKVPATGKIPAHLLGNMWAQEWGNIYPLVAPFPDAPTVDVTAALQAKPYEAKEMVRLAEKFFTSLGLDPLPDTFWERSMFTKPRDRDVVCHASAWDVTYDNDLRLKMCIKIDFEDLVTVHHELGHHYYYMYYHQLPVIYQNGAHDGFHEGIGDTLALSVGPDYLQKVGVLSEGVEMTDEALVNQMLRTALDKIAFLPFGRMIDQWRWDVFSGKIPEDGYNEAWWKLREKYQGIAAPVERSEKDFDPGAKYHIPANTPYMRYFLARILQFQFHRALCKAAGHEGPVHTCSIYGSKAAGEKLKAMLAMGASKPWPEALKALSGETSMDASALVEYFAPLSDWLAKQNEGRSCGW